MNTIRLVITAVVMIILMISTNYNGWWKNKYLRKLFFFLSFNQYEKYPDSANHHYYLVGTQQWVHFSLGVFTGFIFNPLISPILTTLIIGVAKEIIDVLTSGKWHKKDSIVDLSFWVLGGFASPLLEMARNAL